MSQLIKAEYEVERDEGEEERKGKWKGKEDKKKIKFSFSYEYDILGNRIRMLFESEKEGMFDPRFKRPKDKEPVLKHPFEIFYSYDGQKLTSLQVKRLINNKIWYKVKFEYDTRGNLAEKEVTLDRTYKTRYIHDVENRLQVVYYPDGSIEEFVNLEGLVLKRRYIDEEGKVREQILIYDEVGGLPHVLVEFDENGKPERRYVLSDKVNERMWVRVFGDDEEPKGRIYYHTDHLGTVMLLTDIVFVFSTFFLFIIIMNVGNYEEGKKVGEYGYSPFGEVLEAESSRAKKNFYLFTGREYLERLGMYDFKSKNL